MEEEIELFKDLDVETEKDTPIVVEGDIFLTINNYGNNKNINLKKIRSKVTKPLKQSIKKRDLETCICCKRKFKSHLEVHHIMPVSKYPELACVPENLVSLCQQCHAKYHELYKDDGGAVSFANFLRTYGR